MRRSAFAAAAIGLAVALTVGSTGPAAAQTTYSVELVAPSSAYSVQGDLTELDGQLYFPGSRPPDGPTQLWRVDPTTGVAAQVATAQAAEFADVAFTVASGGFVYFIGLPVGAGSYLRLYRYDPATDTATTFADNGAPVVEYVIAGGIPYTIDGTDVARFVDPEDPAAPPTALVPAPCADGSAYENPTDLTVLGDDRVAFRASCPTTSALFVYDPGTGMTVIDPINPTGADLSDPADAFEYDGDIFFSAGLDSDARRAFRFDPGSNVVTETDPSTRNPGRAFLFEGRPTWLAVDAAAADGRQVIVQWDGANAVRLPIASYGELLVAVTAVPWGDRLLLNGFYSEVGGGDSTAFAYDPRDGVFTRLVPTGGAFVAPFVSADGTGYVVAISGDAPVLYRVTATGPTPPPPSPPAPPTPPVLIPTG